MQFDNNTPDSSAIHFSPYRQIEVSVSLRADGQLDDMPSNSSNAGFVLVCQSGTATFEFLHERHHITPRDIIVVFPGDKFDLRDFSSDFSASWVSFSPAVGDEVLYNFPNSFFKHLVEHPVYNLANTEEYNLRLRYLQLIHTHLSDRENVCRYEIVGNLLRILFMEIYNRVVRNFRINTTEPKRRRRLLDEFMNLLVTHPQRRDVAYFAESLCISPKYLSQIVREGTGFAAKEFIDRNTITEIKQLLRTADLSIKEIAERLDFPNNSNLCRFFKSRTGITISKFKQQVRS
ncbi:MAG: AraC family transcriptional regulator [Alistipes sp.]|nr:AraC family transcriptional regulator [Alistipes sp.]